MSVTREWNSLKAAWLFLLLIMAIRLFLSSQFLLTPDEALYWQASQDQLPKAAISFPTLSMLIKLSTAIFGNSELAVRLPSVLGISLALIFASLLAASMFSWHTALHFTLLAHGILLLNLAAIIVNPYSLVLPCWAATCYYSSQAMNDNTTGHWLLAGLWFGLGLACKLSMLILLPCLVLCLVFVKPYRTCLLYPGPWFGFLFSLMVYLGVTFSLGHGSPGEILEKIDIVVLAANLVPDLDHSLHFLIDQSILATPFVFILLIASWLPGANRRNQAVADMQFLLLTSLPPFLLFLLFPVFSGKASFWTAVPYLTALVLLAGLHSSTRSSFKGRPTRRWLVAISSAYFCSIPLLLQVAYPAIPLPLNFSQTSFSRTGWDQLGRTMDRQFEQIPDKDNTFIFSMDARVSAELSYYMQDNPPAVSLDQLNRVRNGEFLGRELKLPGKNGLGLVSTAAALEQAERLFDQVELLDEITLETDKSHPVQERPSFFLVFGYNYRSI